MWKERLFCSDHCRTVSPLVAKTDSLEESDRFFYSDNIKLYLIELIEDKLQEMQVTFQRDVGEVIYAEYSKNATDFVHLTD